MALSLRLGSRLRLPSCNDLLLWYLIFDLNLYVVHINSKITEQTLRGRMVRHIVLLELL